MRRLSKTYWDMFTKKDTRGMTKRDGIIFEDLVECLLQIEYDLEWIRTPKSHDNNRDFHLTTLEFTYWAECKNYNNVIAMDTIAPTLVMAQIFEVNKLIFFSYSDINFSARNKIFSFGTKTKKEIEIFAGNTLDDLIIKHRKFLPEKFRPQDEQINCITCIKPLEYQFYFIQTPILGVTKDDRDMMSISDVQKITYNTIFEIALVCTNNTLETDYQIEVKLNNEVGKDNPYFTLVDYELENTPDLFHAKTIPEAGGILNRYYFKSNRFKPFLMLPVFEVTIHKCGKIIESFCSPAHVVKNQWIGKTILIGEQYRSAIKKLEKNILGNDEFSCFMVYGPSGTGKTRLLKEMLDVLLKHKYRIASFIGNENDSAFILLKELIYFVYEVPRDEILKNLEDDMFLQKYADKSTPASQAYSLARRFSTVHSDNELIDVIEESFDIIYEKISKERIAIIIDNVQFFGNALIHFLKKYILYSKHQTRANSSILVLSFNQDYTMDKATELLEYIQDLSKDRQQIECNSVTGFRDKNQGILFLRELMHIEDDRLDSEFDIILNKSTLKPFYIYQAVYYLYEEDAITETDDEKGYIPRLERFHDVIEKMPPKVKEIISKRWDLFWGKLDLDELEISTIIASIYLFRELNPKIIQFLRFDTSLLQLLSQHMFLRINENGNYCFEHDIIEDFFVTRFDNLNLLIINQIRRCRVARRLSDYPFVNLYYKLYGKNLTTEKIEDIYEKTFTLSIHPKHATVYYTKLLKVALENRKHYEDDEQWMSLIFGICNLAKNYIGIKKAENLLESVNYFLENNITNSLLLTNSFRNYMNIYADILFYQKRHEEAITYLEKIDQIPLNDQNDQVYALKSMIHNRLLINHRELPSQYHRRLAEKSLSTAVIYANMIQESLLKDEFIFMNISDEGYNYYCMYDQREKLLSVWYRCMDYPPLRLPQKAMNYYRKCLQINLIEQQYDQVFDIIQEANDYMKTHCSSNMEKLNFSLSFAVYKIMALIQENPIENRHILFKEITHAIELSNLMAKRNLYQLLILKAVVCYYNGDSMGTYFQYREAYIFFNRKPGALFYSKKKDLLLANIYVSFKKFDILYKAKDFLSDADQIKFGHLSIELSDYEANGIQRTSDKLLNLPCV